MDGHGHGVVPLGETYAIGGEFLMAKMNTEVRSMRGEIGADLCQTATIVRVFLWWGRRFLAEPEANEGGKEGQLKEERLRPGVCSFPLFISTGPSGLYVGLCDETRADDARGN